MKNEQFTTQYVDNFTDNEPIPSVEDETSDLSDDSATAFLLRLSTAMPSSWFAETDTNLVIIGDDARGRGCRLSYRAGTCCTL